MGSLSEAKEFHMDDSIQIVLEKTAGLVLVPREDYVIAWTGVIIFLTRYSYTPETFVAALKTKRPPIAIAKKLLRVAEERFGETVDLAVRVGEHFHRYDLSGPLVGVRGVMQFPDDKIRVA
jgi:hypothetical protein